MARDRTRNVYFTVGIPIASETHHALRADALETGVSIPQLLAVRITDWYKLLAGGGPIIGMPVSRPTGNTPEQLSGMTHTDDLQARASAAAAAWGGEDDE